MLLCSQKINAVVSVVARLPRILISCHSCFPLCFPAFDQMLKKLHKACVQYPAWKQQHNVNMKPWLYPEQNKLPVLALSELALQRAASLENIDESSLAEEKDESSDHGGLEN